jgi:hypothetical protein
MSSDFDFEREPPPRRSQQGMKFPLFLLGGCLVVAAGGVIIALMQLHRPDSSSAAPHSAPADLTVDAQALFSSYCDSMAIADRTYQGKILDISGTVATVGRDEKGPYLIYAVIRPYHGGPVSLASAYNRIAAAGASGVQGVRCYLAKSITHVKVGQTITLRGRCAGMPLDVEIRDCTLPAPVRP